jgi:hypothetical protein
LNVGAANEPKDSPGLSFCFSAAREHALEKSFRVEPRAAEKQQVSGGSSSCYKQATPLGLVKDEESDFRKRAAI